MLVTIQVLYGEPVLIRLHSYLYDALRVQVPSVVLALCLPETSVVQRSFYSVHPFLLLPRNGVGVAVHDPFA